jgi:hypothetical protein
MTHAGRVTRSGRSRHRRTGLAAAIGLLIAAALLASTDATASFEGFESSEPTGSAPADSADGSVPEVAAHALPDGEKIHVDGRLDDDAWQDTPGNAGFRVWNPDRGREPSEQTVFKVAYDDEALYFAIACIEDDPGRIAKRLSRRDRFSDSDLVSIYIDPYHDRTTGYNFQVNPLGVQQDSYIYNDGDTDSDWDAVWEAETSEDADGWYAELRVPFSSIRYRADGQPWGLEVFRNMHSRGEETAWVVWDRDAPGFVSRFGRLSGLKNIPSPRQLEVLPYFVMRATDPAVTGPEKIHSFQNFGADLKYGLTSDLTLAATVQPDFGQVEADPAVLNLSPFETFFDEKRPFFVEGNRFFQFPNFNLFYSRRIGTGSENSRIRYATKLTGKTGGDVSLAALVASTDVTGEGRTHNVFRNGSQLSRYVVGRLGKELSGGDQRVSLMQTAVLNAASRDDYGDRASREAYTSGADFDLRFADRAYAVQGSFVGSVISPERLKSEAAFRPARTYGTGGELDLSRDAGKLHGGVYGRWESDRLDLNDIGFLSAPDEIDAGGWLSYRYSPDGDSRLMNRGNLNLNLSRSWLYGARTGYDLQTNSRVWSYDQGHPAFTTGNVNGWAQLRGFEEAWFGLQWNARGTQRHETRNSVLLLDGERSAVPGGGPLIGEPETYGGWYGASTDTRKNAVVNIENSHYFDTAKNASHHLSLGLRWNQTSATSHEIELGYQTRRDDTQHIENFENPGGGIGGVSFVFGEIQQKTLDVRLRTNLIFNRNSSLEIYAQPFLTVGDYSRPRELLRPDTYDLAPYAADGFSVDDSDFRYGSVNLNVVYRWQYRPGSTLFLVWTQSRSSYDERAFHSKPGSFDGGIGTAPLFKNEPESVLLAKVTYWLPI